MAKAVTKTKSGFEKAINVIIGIALAVILVLVVMLYGVRLIGITPYVVLTGSMEPTYGVGSLVYVKDKPAEEIQVGDVVTYRIQEGTVVTHRVIETDSENRQVTTQGDANNTVDAPVSYENIVGVVLFGLPNMGSVANFMSSTSGKIAIICVVGILILLSFLPGLLGTGSASEKKVFEDKDGSKG